MWVASGPWKNRGMSSSQAPLPYGKLQPGYYPRFTRPPQGRVVGGVAVGLAQHLRVKVTVVRVALIIAALLSGMGLAFYALLWIASRPGEVETGAQTSRRGRTTRSGLLLLVLFTLAGAGLSISYVTGAGVSTLIPLGVAAAGALVAWQAYDRGFGSFRSLLAIGFGSLLVLAGIVVVVFNWEGSSFITALLAVLLTLAGVAGLAVPVGLRLWDSLLQERDAKAAADERAEIASHLHDSVLQTLALIQKRAQDPAEVTRLARGQERELRQWLFDAPEKLNSTIFAAVETAAGEVEDMFGIRIAPVTVGTDQPLDERTQAVVLAAREAMVNVAKHAGVEAADVYAEILGGELGIYIRDRGAGFDPEQVPGDRHGIRDSIRERVERIGGAVKIRSTPGEGTEVTLTLALS